MYNYYIHNLDNMINSLQTSKNNRENVGGILQRPRMSRRKIIVHLLWPCVQIFFDGAINIVFETKLSLSVLLKMFWRVCLLLCGADSDQWGVGIFLYAV